MLEEALVGGREMVADLVLEEIAALTLLVRGAEPALLHRRRRLEDNGQDHEPLARRCVELHFAWPRVEEVRAEHRDAHACFGHLAQPLLHPVLARLHLLAIERVDAIVLQEVGQLPHALLASATVSLRTVREDDRREGLL
eukprot:scaffold13674_cov61-Phaeocystis_antarctica.AAC.2